MRTNTILLYGFQNFTIKCYKKISMWDIDILQDFLYETGKYDWLATCFLKLQSVHVVYISS